VYLSLGCQHTQWSPAATAAPVRRLQGYGVVRSWVHGMLCGEARNKLGLKTRLRGPQASGRGASGRGATASPGCLLCG
jgi:hypothetical protein